MNDELLTEKEKRLLTEIIAKRNYGFFDYAVFKHSMNNAPRFRQTQIFGNDEDYLVGCAAYHDYINWLKK